MLIEKKFGYKVAHSQIESGGKIELSNDLFQIFYSLFHSSFITGREKKKSHKYIKVYLPEHKHQVALKATNSN